jgi:hypothetical protein
MLDPVIEDVDRAAETRFREAAGGVPIGPGDDDSARQPAREHERLVARAPQVRAHTVGVADDDDI